MQDALDQGRGEVEEFQVRLDIIVVGGRRGLRGPQDGIVIREGREDDAQEETGCCTCWRCVSCAWGCFRRAFSTMLETAKTKTKEDTYGRR